MNALADNPTKREPTPLEVALAGDPELLIDPYARELREQERLSDRFLTDALLRRYMRPDELMNTKSLLKLIEDELDAIQVFVKLRLTPTGEVEIESASPADRLIAISEIKKRGLILRGTPQPHPID